MFRDVLRLVAVVALVVHVAAAGVEITQPQNGATVECGSTAVWLEFKLTDFTIGTDGSAHVFVNNEYFVTLTNAEGGLEEIEPGPTVIEVRLHDADDNVIAKHSVQITAESHESDAPRAATPGGLSARDFVPAPGETSPQGQFLVVNPKLDSTVDVGAAVPIGYRLENAMNAHMGDVVVIANGHQQIYQFQGAEGHADLPGFPAGRHTLTLRLLGPEPAPWKNMEATTVFTVGDKEEVETAMLKDLCGETVEPEEPPSIENLIMAIGDKEDIAFYQTFLLSLKATASAATVALFVPSTHATPEVRALIAEHNAYLTVYNADKVPGACRADEGAGPGCTRLWLFRHFLMEHLMEFGQARVLITDLDTLFQSDPFIDENVAGDELNLFAVSNDLVIEDDDDYSHYIMDQCVLYRGEMLNQIGAEKALYSGVMLGSFEQVSNYLDTMVSTVFSSTVAQSRKFDMLSPLEGINACHQQGVHNVLAYTHVLDAFGGQKIHTSEQGPVFVTHKWPALRMDKDMKVLLPSHDGSAVAAAFVTGVHDFPDVVAALSGGSPSATADANGVTECHRKQTDDGKLRWNPEV